LTSQIIYNFIPLFLQFVVAVALVWGIFSTRNLHKRAQDFRIEQDLITKITDIVELIIENSRAYWLKETKEPDACANIIKSDFKRLNLYINLFCTHNPKMNKEIIAKAQGNFRDAVTSGDFDGKSYRKSKTRVQELTNKALPLLDKLYTLN